jgi:hypothetical protein
MKKVLLVLIVIFVPFVAWRLYSGPKFIADESINSWMGVNRKVGIAEEGCATPKLSVEQVKDIALKSGLPKPIFSGWWEYGYYKKESWNYNPYPDPCIWVVRLIKPAYTSDSNSLGLDNIFIRDSNGESDLNGTLF